MPSGLAAAAELWLPGLERPEAKRRPRVVDRDLADGPEPEIGEDRPERVTVDIGLVALGVEDPQVAGPEERRAVGREAVADSGGVVGDHDRRRCLRRIAGRLDTVRQRPKQPAPPLFRNPQSGARLDQQLVGDGLVGHDRTPFSDRRTRLAQGRAPTDRRCAPGPRAS